MERHRKHNIPSEVPEELAGSLSGKILEYFFEKDSPLTLEELRDVFYGENTLLESLSQLCTSRHLSIGGMYDLSPKDIDSFDDGVVVEHGDANPV